MRRLTTDIHDWDCVSEGLLIPIAVGSLVDWLAGLTVLRLRLGLNILWMLGILLRIRLRLNRI